MKILPILLAGSAFVAASGAAAQSQPEQDTTAPDTAAEAPATTQDDAASTADPATDTAATTAATFTDEQVASFAAAALKIAALGETKTATQEQLTTIVTESGLDPQTYVAINNAMKNDDQLAQRVRVAANAIQQNPAG